MSDIKKKTFKNKNLFDYLGNILCGKDIETYFKHIAEEGFDIDFKKVVLIKYLSMSPDPNVRQIVLDNQLTFDRMNCKTLYRYLLRVVPKQRSAFIKYLK